MKEKQEETCENCGQFERDHPIRDCRFISKIDCLKFKAKKIGILEMAKRIKDEDREIWKQHLNNEKPKNHSPRKIEPKPAVSSGKEVEGNHSQEGVTSGEKHLKRNQHPDTKEFDLEEIKKKPTKDLTEHEKYLRYKRTFTENNRRIRQKYPKKYWAEKVRVYASKNKQKIVTKDLARYYIPIPDNQLCQRCKIEKATQRHHEDYSKPFKVEFLCRNCHGEADRKRREKENG